MMSVFSAFPPLLSSPEFRTNQFRFELEGETLGRYVIEASTNLQEWLPAGTNEARASRREVVLPASGSGGFVRAIADPANRFRFALAARGQIDLSGSRSRVDNFDSSSELYSTNGRYDPTKALDTAEVAVGSSVVDSLSIGSLALAGTITAETVEDLPGDVDLVVGSKTWHDTGQTGLEPGHAFGDLELAWPEVGPPFTGGAFTPFSGFVNETFYTYVLRDFSYFLSSLNLNSFQKLAVTGHTVLYVGGNISITGSAHLEVFPGASLRLYSSGSNVVIGGAGVINHTGRADAFIYYGMPDNTNLSVTISDYLTGCIYAPNADITLSYGGSAVAQFIGSCTGRNIYLNGFIDFHYDEALRSGVFD